MINYRKQRYITTALSFLLAGATVAPLAAQETPANAPLVAAASASAEAEAPEMSEQAEKAIERGLKFLISSQNKDGSWSSKDPKKAGDGGYSIAGTSLALMAFMVEGHFPGFGPYGNALDRAKDYLLKRSKDSATGAMGVKMYEIGLYTIAMSELWGMTSDPDDNKEIQVALERVVEVILRSQSPLGGWRYAPRPDAGQDTSVTAMVFVSLASAREAGVLVPTETIERLTGYLRDQAFDEQRGGFGYQGKGYTIACTAGGVYAAQLAGNRDAEWVQQALTTLENEPKMFSRKENGHFYYSHYYAMQAMVQAGEEHYARWYPKISEALISLQQPNGSWQEKELDYPHKTPMSIIILGTPNRYIPVYQR
ncbi:prenyltransferase/squalene oxidase repeat-containing protein [Rubritalea profundi]|uniref:prenyltransferase/squalene oxidase repeat-containing protein n=1 Tax=Rubritalea profundi TaxID=1658618 RepID=UPI000CF553F8|nr:prenyltransferase/squalene oxidase repeat-containing protein [Rubritalea profundi]